MSGKQHSIIGVVIAMSLYIVSIIYSFTNLSFKLGITLLLGAFIGSLIVDIDSKKSKASQLFTKIVVYLLWGVLAILVINKYTNLGLLNYVVNLVMNSAFTLQKHTGLLVMVVLTTLGKLSPHRGFTHKILGTVLFIATCWFTFGFYFSIGFTLGYVLHLLADKTTDNGLDIFQLRLPFQDHEGDFKIHF